MAFEEFQARGRIISKDPRVTITKTGQIHFNTACDQQWIEPRKAEHVVLMYDRDTQRVGIKILDQPVAHAYPLRKTKNSRQCSASSFVRFYEIEHDQTRSYPAEWSEKDDAIVFQLSEGRIATKKRSGK